jgi:hypothetical protein
VELGRFAIVAGYMPEEFDSACAYQRITPR